MKGKVAVVTGGTSGLGYGTALGLARRGARVVIVGRDRERGRTAARRIAQEAGDGDVTAVAADISSLASVRELGRELAEQYPAIHALVNNAAVFKATQAVTSDGLESMFATNHLGHFLLTHLLMDALRAGAPSVVVNITAPSTSRLTFDDLHGERRFSALGAFGASKMANLLFTGALAPRFEGTGVTVFAYHPGLMRTGLMRDLRSPFRLLTGVANLFATKPERAGEDLAALLERQPPADWQGKLIHKGRPIAMDPYASEDDAQESLWEASLRLAGMEGG